MKRGFSIFLITVLIISTISIGTTTNAISVDTKTTEQNEFIYNASFSLEDITWDDIMAMQSNEFRELLIWFEKTYDPFDTYDTNPITARYNESETDGIQPLWKSGSGELSDDPKTHEQITAQACGILLSDKGFWGNNQNGSIMIGLMLSLASVLPDTIPELGIEQGYKGHFYDPQTGKNYDNDSENTARKNLEKHYNEAMAEYKSNGGSNAFIESVGKMLHYMQDICVPHHAANVTRFNLAHPEFERQANRDIDTYLDTMPAIYTYAYTNCLKNSAGHMALVAATKSRAYIGDVNNILQQKKWPSVAESCIHNSVEYSVLLLYHLSVNTGIPLTK